MNPHYNQQQQQPYYNYQQHIPGPPQPQWQNTTPQSPTMGWHDPRFQSVPVPVPPPPPPSQSQYNQTGFAPIPSHVPQYPYPSPGSPAPTQQPSPRPPEGSNRPVSPQYDSAQWGVKYNQNPQSQYNLGPQSLQPDQKPALPPRPGSSLAYAAQQQQHYPPADNYQVPTQQQHQGSWNINYQSQSHNPPTPPPRPAAYGASPQLVQSGLPHDQYSHHAPTHHYDPQPHQQPSWQQPQPQQTAPSNQPIWDHHGHTTEGPVSPMEDDSRRQSLAGRANPHFVDMEPPSQNVQLPKPPFNPSITPIPEPRPSSTTFGGYTGFGSGPSDWQHYEPTDHQEVIGTPGHTAHTGEQAPVLTASPVQTTVPLRRKSVERVRPPSNVAAPYPSAQPTAHSAVTAAQNVIPETQTSTRITSPASQPVDRNGSNQSTISSVSGVDRSDTIDNVIQAWSAPITVDSSIQTSLPPTRVPSRTGEWPIIPRVEQSTQGTQTNFPPQVETRIETRVETKTIEVDPYADLQNEAKATLNRFAEMLRQEAVTEKDEDKFKIFQGFVIRETRLRGVLYGVEIQPHETAATAEHNQARDMQSNTSQSQPKVVNLSQNQLSSAVRTQSMKQPTLPGLNTKAPATPMSKDDSFVPTSANGDNDDYSPGGRPRIAPLKPKTPRLADIETGSSHHHPAVPASKPADSSNLSPSMNAPMTLDDYVMPDQPVSPSANAPIVVGSDDVSADPVADHLTGPINFQPDRPLYQPFRYGDGVNAQIPSVQVQGPPSQSFAALRQNQAVESGRTLVHDPPPINVDIAPNRSHSKTPSGGRQEHEEAFIGLIRAKSQAIRKKVNPTPRPESPAILRAGTPASRSTPSPAPVSPLIKSVQSLQTLIPRTVPHLPGPKSPPHPKLEPIVTAMQGFIDDFGFIHARVLGWDKSNRQVRAKQDSERQLRQSHNEERIDQLFNDNEIGYADIAELEKDFKLEEAGRKYREDQDELDSFTKGVFNVVTEKLEGELKELTRLKTNVIDILDLESISGAKQVQNSIAQTGSTPATAVPVTATMQVLLDIHDKFEVRQMKIAEAKFERERRRKRLELSVLYTNNDRPGIRKLEAEFSKAEKFQILEESRKQAERANRLFEGFDRAVVRGLAENQGVIDDVLTRVALVRDLILGSEEHAPPGQVREDLLYGPEGVRDLMDRTLATIDFVLQNSKALVQLLDQADSLSNNADFDLYMSEAKLADASPEKFEKLKSEKTAEDGKVREELTSRLNGISRTPEEISVLAREVRDKIGTDPGHEERIGKALEAAKRRNTGSIG